MADEIRPTKGWAPGEFVRFREMGFGGPKVASEEEHALAAVRGGADPEFLKKIMPATPNHSKVEAAARAQAQAKYSKMQKEAWDAQHQRAEAEKPTYTAEEIAKAESKVSRVKRGLDEPFKKILFDPSHTEHRKVSAEWSELNKIVHAGKRQST